MILLESNSLNNFSISTDELATGLQKAGATLSLMGNSLDESAALITSANATIQDVNSVAAGIKTISLRIVGTEEAKNELAELGEETDDYVVATKAKKQQIIKDYTAVPSNNGNGVDILDENGNYRNTYSILKDISEIYSEIQKQDKETGSNRAQALVEELAGKNRSNILSSLLTNGSLLEQVKETSEYSNNSAQEENEKYLESTEAKISQLQTQLQELATVTIDSDMFKGVIDTATAFLNIVTQILDKLPLLSTAIGSIVGLKLSKSGLGKQLNINHKASFNSKFYRS